MKSLFQEDNNRFGFDISNNEIKFFAPKFLLKNIKFDNKFSQIDTIKKYMFILKSYANYNSDKILYCREDTLKSFDLLEAYINIIDDYVKNGDFALFLNTTNTSPRKINWSKTIRNNDLIFQDNNILYGTFTSQAKKNNNSDFFFLLYNYVLNDASCIFLNNENTQSIMLINENEALYHINKYLDTHFRDREIFIAKQLKKIFCSRNFSNINEKAFEIKYNENFEHIFQFLVESNIYKYSVQKFKKNGYYKNLYSQSNKAGLSLRLDHFIHYKEKYYILDSKYYYDFLYENELFNMPKTSDIIKQVGYKLYISEIKSIHPAKICSVFIFPSEDKGVDFFSEHLVDNDENRYFSIKCLKININELIDNFLTKDLHYDLLKLLDLINED